MTTSDSIRIFSGDVLEEALQEARLKLRYSYEEILSILTSEDGISLVFLTLSMENLILRGFALCDKVNKGSIKDICKYLLNVAPGHVPRPEDFDPILEALYLIGRMDILEDYLGLCIDHNIHMICENLRSLSPERICLYQVFSSMTQEAANHLLSARLSDWYFQEGKPLEMNFCRNLTAGHQSYYLCLGQFVRALQDEGMLDFAAMLKPFVNLDSESETFETDTFSYSTVYSLPICYPHGLCVIINVKKFLPPRPGDEEIELDERVGSDIDKDLLTGTFKLFGFKVLHLDNPDYDDISSFFKGLRTNSFLNSVACLAVCFMSHGDKDDNLYLYDRTAISATDLRKLCFSEALINKPRMYFIQACRGDQHLRPVLLQQDATTTTNSESDCLICAATTRGYSALRSQSSGSWFISDLCTSLQEIGHVKRLQHVLQLTRRRLMERVDKMNRGYVTQMSEDISTLTKDVQLIRGDLNSFLEGICDLTQLQVLEEEFEALVSLAVDDIISSDDLLAEKLFKSLDV